MRPHVDFRSSFTTPPRKSGNSSYETPQEAKLTAVDNQKEAMDRVFELLKITRSSDSIHTSEQSLTLIFHEYVPLGAYRTFYDEERYNEYKEKLKENAPGIMFYDSRFCVYTPILEPITREEEAMNRVFKLLEITRSSESIDAMDRVFELLEITRSSESMDTSDQQSLTLTFQKAVPLGAYRTFHDEERYKEYKGIITELQKNVLVRNSIPTGITLHDSRSCVYTPLLEPIPPEDVDDALKKKLTEVLEPFWNAGFVHGDLTKATNLLEGRQLFVHLGNFMSQNGRYVLIDYETTTKANPGDIDDEKEKWTEAVIPVDRRQELQQERKLQQERLDSPFTPSRFVRRPES